MRVNDDDVVILKVETPAMRYMMNHYRSVLGAVLIEATNDSETWVKWTQDKITDMVGEYSNFI